MANFVTIDGAAVNAADLYTQPNDALLGVMSYRNLIYGAYYDFSAAHYPFGQHYLIWNGSAWAPVWKVASFDFAPHSIVEAAPAGVIYANIQDDPTRETSPLPGSGGIYGKLMYVGAAGAIAAAAMTAYGAVASGGEVAAEPVVEELVFDQVLEQVAEQSVEQLIAEEWVAEELIFDQVAEQLIAEELVAEELIFDQVVEQSVEQLVAEELVAEELIFDQVAEQSVEQLVAEQTVKQVSGQTWEQWLSTQAQKQLTNAGVSLLIKQLTAGSQTPSSVRPGVSQPTYSNYFTDPNVLPARGQNPDLTGAPDNTILILLGLGAAALLMSK